MNQTKDKNSNLLQEYDKKLELYQSFLNEIEHQISAILKTSGVTVNAITARLKTRESLEGKIERKHDKYSTISDITDIVGVRIITYFSDDVDKIAKIIEKEFEIDHENSIDKRESMEPDRFGYCSVHYVVKMSRRRLKLRECTPFKDLKCEIQIRSVLQHAWAEIEHDIGYKSEITIPKEIRRDFSRIAGLLEIADKEFNQIRISLAEYKARLKNEIHSRKFLNHEIDSEILRTLLNQNDNILRLNLKIKELMGRELADIEDYNAKLTIQRLKWFNIVTVGQLLNLISKYTDTAVAIACEKLKNYKIDENSIVTKGIAFFYLCYAILLSEYCEVEKIEKYLEDVHIGRDVSKHNSAENLYNIGVMLGLSV